MASTPPPQNEWEYSQYTQVQLHLVNVTEIKMKIGFSRYHDHDAIYNEPAEAVQAGRVGPPPSGRVRVKLDVAERGVIVIRVVLCED